MSEINRQPIGLRIVPEHLRGMSPLQLMRIGFDTEDIAVSTRRSEAVIYNWMISCREAEYRKKFGVVRA